MTFLLGAKEMLSLWLEIFDYEPASPSCFSLELKSLWISIVVDISSLFGFYQFLDLLFLLASVVADFEVTVTNQCYLGSGGKGR